MSLFRVRFVLATVTTGVSGLSLWLIQKYPTAFVFVAVMVGWIFLVLLMSWVLHRSHRFLDFLAIELGVMSGGVGLFGIVEWAPGRWVLLVFISVFLGLLVGFPSLDEHVVFYDQKPVRRFWMMGWVLTVYGWYASGFALSLFFPTIPTWLPLFGASLIAGAGAGFIWRLYVRCTWQEVWLWSLIVTMMMLELGWVLLILPFGYFISACLVTWWWFMIQLFLRFHFTPNGILWKKQRWFLFANAFILFLILWQFVRWV